MSGGSALTTAKVLAAIQLTGEPHDDSLTDNDDTLRQLLTEGRQDAMRPSDVGFSRVDL